MDVLHPWATIQFWISKLETTVAPVRWAIATGVAHMVAVAVGNQDVVGGDSCRLDGGQRIAGDEGVDQSLALPLSIRKQHD